MTKVQEKVLRFSHLKDKPWIIAKLTSVRTRYVKRILNIKKKEKKNDKF